jgi:ureidoglycolate hydrolase
MSEVIEIRVEPLSPEAFAPFGQLICARSDEPPVFEAPQHLRSWRQEFEVEGPTELMYIHYLHRPIQFSTLERHFQVTQTFVALGGAASVMVVAPPSGRDSVPEPGELRTFFVPGTVGLMLWRGTWHALTRFPATPGGAGFAFLTDANTQRELEKQRADGTPPKLTQALLVRSRCDFENRSAACSRFLACAREDGSIGLRKANGRAPGEATRTRGSPGCTAQGARDDC